MKFFKKSNLQKALLGALVFLSLATVQTASALPGAESMPLIGEWKYNGFIYEGRQYPSPNPALFLSFTFFPTGEVRLFWKRDDEDFFCERLAYYKLDGNMLSQKIFWVNPENHLSCGQDPDMRVGTVTVNKVEWTDTQLSLFLELNGKDFVYLLEKLMPAKP